MNKLGINALDNNYVIKPSQTEEQKYLALRENNSFYVVKTDLQGRFTYVNPLFCHDFDLEKTQWLQQDFTGLILPDDHQAYLNMIKYCATQVGQLQTLTLRGVRHSEVAYIQWDFKVVQLEGKAIAEIFCIGHDVTPVIQQHELEEVVDDMAEQIKKLLDFTYLISHNIRSHVANIMGIINLNEYGDQEDKELSWEFLKRSVNGLDATIHNLNDIVAMQTKTKLSIKKIYIRAEFDRIIDTIRLLYDEADAKVVFNFYQLAFLCTNPAYFESIILNLITNAIKYKSPARPLLLQLSLTDHKGYAVLTFKDNGTGINLEKNGDKIFGMYKTFHGNVDAKGLGLFIVKTQIEAMGGKIEVDSVVDQFTSFKLYLKNNPFTS